MDEEAAIPVGTDALVLEGAAGLGFIAGVEVGLAHDLVSSVGEATLLPVVAEAQLDPILTHFCFEFASFVALSLNLAVEPFLFF